MTTRLIDKLAQVVSEDDAQAIHKAAHYAVIGGQGFKRWPWYRASLARLFRLIGRDNMIDQFAGEMVIAKLRGESTAEAYVSACKVLTPLWRQEDWRDVRESSVEAAAEAAAVIPQLVVDIDFDPEAITHDERATREVVKAIAALSEMQRNVIELRTRYSIKETAAMLGRSPKTVQNNQTQAHKALRDALSD